jgi:hypothetical protein
MSEFTGYMLYWESLYDELMMENEMRLQHQAQQQSQNDEEFYNE